MASSHPTVDEIGALLKARNQTLAVAESLTGGLLAAAFAEGAEASSWFRGGIVAYAEQVKHELLHVPDVPVVSEECARAMAEGALRVLGADVAVALTGVGGPDPQDGQPPGTVWVAVAAEGHRGARLLHADGEPPTVCARSIDAAVRAVRAALG